MQISNFDFLEKDWTVIAEIGKQAENNMYLDSNTMIYKIRMLSETIAKYMLKFDKIQCESDRQIDRIHLLKKNGLIPYEIEQIFKVLRITGNKAVHENYVGKNEEELNTYLSLALKLAAWFYEVYGNNYNFSADKVQYRKPEHIDYVKEYEKLKERVKNVDIRAQELDETQKIDREIENINIDELKLKPAKERLQLIKNKRRTYLNEAETRILIDAKLREAGWEVDSIELKYKGKGVLPRHGRRMAIAEWPCKKDDGSDGFADYVLFDGMCPIAIIEAKRYSEDVMTALVNDANMYAKGFVSVNDEIKLYREGIKEGEHRVPFIFSSNGRDSNEILEKSGILFKDLRYGEKIRSLKGFFSCKDLREFLERDKRDGEKNLKNEKIDYLTSATGLNLRYYQVEAVQAVENAILNGSHRVLITMATGTGKTRTALAILYRLVKTKKYKRILFVVDRTALGTQAMDTFKNVKIEQNTTLNDQYEVLSLNDKEFNDDTRIHITTIQALVKRVANSDGGVTIGSYDCIFVDEAHRGYALDRVINEEEEIFLNEEDYVSRYRNTLDFFDADRIGLTATPALHTVEIFGSPVYNYGFNQAVLDGFLVDKEPEYIITTRLAKDGIHYEKGVDIQVFNNSTKEIEVLENVEDELNFEIDDFNTKVITEGFNRAVCEYLVNEINPEGPEKTLIFAATDNHADMVVRILKEEYAKAGIYNVNDDTIVKITGSVKDVGRLINKYKLEQFPTIAVTVDLLTTGIDVPKITNLVFLRRTKSRILYEQMLGRATRKCDEIGKESFKVYDAVDLTELMADVTQMKSVVKSINKNMEKFLESIEENKSDTEAMEVMMAEIIGRLQRKKHIIEGNKDNKDIVIYQTGKNSLDEYIAELKSTPKDEIYNKIQQEKKTLRVLDNLKKGDSYQIIITDNDEIVDLRQKFKKGTNPKDYLEEFKKYIEENKDKIEALKVLRTTPEKLTKDDLMTLKLKLSVNGFGEVDLNTAYSKTTNATITASILDYVKNVVRGSEIKDKGERINEAITNIKKINRWNSRQIKLIENIGNVMKENMYFDKEDIESGRFRKEYGDYERINKILDGKIDEILEIIRKNTLIN